MNGSMQAIDIQSWTLRAASLLVKRFIHKEISCHIFSEIPFFFSVDALQGTAKRRKRGKEKEDVKQKKFFQEIAQFMYSRIHTEKELKSAVAACERASKRQKAHNTMAAAQWELKKYFHRIHQTFGTKKRKPKDLAGSYERVYAHDVHKNITYRYVRIEKTYESIWSQRLKSLYYY